MRPLRVLQLSGNGTRRGHAHGEAYAAAIREYAEERIALAANGTWAGRPATQEDVLAIARRMLPAHAAYDADLYAEMVALAEAAGISP